jgi:hypothetical protein
MKTGTANLSLHHGRAPRWLLWRTDRLALAIAVIGVDEHGTIGFLKRLADPHWVQALGCVLGFHRRSGCLTGTTCALDRGLLHASDELGLYAGGGRGGTFRRIPEEIRGHASALYGSSLPLDSGQYEISVAYRRKPCGLQLGLRSVYGYRILATVDTRAICDGPPLDELMEGLDRSGRRGVA